MGLEIITMNEASNVKLAWNLHNSPESRASLFRQRVIRKNKFINHHIFSSIWTSVKDEMNFVIENSSWCIGNGNSSKLWFDNWCSSSLYHDIEDPNSIVDHNVNKITVNKKWYFSKSFTPIPPSIQICINNCHIPFDLSSDKRIWNLSPTGDLYLKLALDFKQNKGIQKKW